MRRAVLVHRGAQNDPERLELDRPCSAGGSRSDAVLLEGLAAAALRLEPCEAGLVVEAAAAGVRAAGHPLAPGGRRLVRPGERIQVRGHALALPREEAAADASSGATRAIASDLLRRASGGAAASAGPHLLVLTGKDAGRRLPLGPEQTLGRSRRATLRLSDLRASRLHARLRVSPDGLTVEDLGARNGLRVNGIPVDAAVRPLRAGDVLGLGETELAVVIPWDAGAAGRTPEPHAAADASRNAAADASRNAAASRTSDAAPGARRDDLRRAAAALLALAALALALAGA